MIGQRIARNVPGATRLEILLTNGITVNARGALSPEMQDMTVLTPNLFVEHAGKK
jgi:hypothetical protein